MRGWNESSFITIIKKGYSVYSHVLKFMITVNISRVLFTGIYLYNST